MKNTYFKATVRRLNETQGQLGGVVSSPRSNFPQVKNSKWPTV